MGIIFYISKSSKSQEYGTESKAFL